MNLNAELKLPERLFQLALAVCVVAIMVLAFAPLEQTLSIAHADKYNHFIAFFVLSMLLDGAYRKTSFDAKKVSCLLAYAFFIELVQSQIPYRHFSWLDMLVDAMGVFSYALFIRALSKYFSR